MVQLIWIAEQVWNNLNFILLQFMMYFNGYIHNWACWHALLIKVQKEKEIEDELDNDR